MKKLSFGRLMNWLGIGGLLVGSQVTPIITPSVHAQNVQPAAIEMRKIDGVAFYGLPNCVFHVHWTGGQNDTVPVTNCQEGQTVSYNVNGYTASFVVTARSEGKQNLNLSVS